MGNDRPDYSEDEDLGSVGSLRDDVELPSWQGMWQRSKLPGQASQPAFSQPTGPPASQQAEERDPLAPYAPIVRIMTMVKEGLPRCEVYFKLVHGPEPLFQLEVLALAAVNGQYFVSTMRTANISTGIQKEKIDTEVQLLVKGIASMLAVASFQGGKEPLPSSAFRMLVEPA
jgi:hypothetical protein